MNFDIWNATHLENIFFIERISDKELCKIHFRCSLVKLIFAIIFNILHFEENQKCFDSSYIHVNESNKCKKSLSVVQLGNQNSASRFNDTLQNKWRTLYCNVSLLLQFTVCVFQYIQSIYFLIILIRIRAAVDKCHKKLLVNRRGKITYCIKVH